MLPADGTFIVVIFLLFWVIVFFFCVGKTFGRGCRHRRGLRDEGTPQSLTLMPPATVNPMYSLAIRTGVLVWMRYMDASESTQPTCPCGNSYALLGTKQRTSYTIARNVEEIVNTHPLKDTPLRLWLSGVVKVLFGYG